MLASPIPNRHAALHGFTSYGTFKGSLNALIIMQFVLRIVTAAKISRRQASDAALEAEARASALLAGRDAAHH